MQGSQTDQVAPEHSQTPQDHIPGSLVPQIALPGGNPIDLTPTPQPSVADHWQIQFGVGWDAASLDPQLMYAQEVFRDQLGPVQQQARGQSAFDVIQRVDEPRE
jgi:hypothetical protein